MVNHGRRIKRDVSSNHTSGSANTTQMQNITTTGVPAVAKTSRLPFLSWPTRRRNTGSPVPLDRLGFPIIPSNHRGTRRPSLPRSESNANIPAVNSWKERGGNFSYEIFGELRERETGTQTSTLRSNTTTSTELISKILHTEKKSRGDDRRDFSLAISKHSIWIAVVASLFLSAFICLTVHWVRQRRRGKLIIAPAGKKDQRSAAVVFKAWNSKRKDPLLKELFNQLV